MSRYEADREDILREATALMERAELTIPGLDESLVAGFRRNGSASFFFGADPVYQFNSAGELRRAYVGGRLIKAQRGALIALTRERTEHEVQLVSDYLKETETSSLLDDLSRRLYLLQSALWDQDFTLLGQVPARSEILARLSTWLAALPQPLKIAQWPNAR